MGLALAFIIFAAAFIVFVVIVSLPWERLIARHPVPAARVPTSGPPPRAFPVIGVDDVPIPEDPDRPGRFRVIGVYREDGRDALLTLPALTTANARVKAELQGVIVTSIVRLEPNDPFENPFAS